MIHRSASQASRPTMPLQERRHWLARLHGWSGLGLEAFVQLDARPLAPAFLTLTVCVARAPRFLVLSHSTICYDTHVNVSLCCERQVTHAPCTSARPCVLRNLPVLPSRPPAHVELWHVYRWGRLR